MGRRKHDTDGQDEQTAEEAPAKAPEDAAPAAEPTIRLRLRENAFIAGVLRLAGYEEDFPVAVAERELRLTQLWDRV